jgi:hypothetical protein
MKPMLKKRSFQSLWRACLRHDENVPFARELADLIGLRARNLDAASAGVIGVIDIEHLVGFSGPFLNSPAILRRRFHGASA